MIKALWFLLVFGLPWSGVGCSWIKWAEDERVALERWFLASIAQ